MDSSSRSIMNFAKPESNQNRPATAPSNEKKTFKISKNHQKHQSTTTTKNHQNMCSPSLVYLSVSLAGKHVEVDEHDEL